MLSYFWLIQQAFRPSDPEIVEEATSRAKEICAAAETAAQETIKRMNAVLKTKRPVKKMPGNNLGIPIHLPPRSD